MKWLLICALLVIIAFVPTTAMGFNWDVATDFLIDQAIPLFGVGGGIGAFILGKLLRDNRKIKRGMQETGEFFKVLGTAMEDGKLSPREIGSIFKEGKDVINLVRKTPAQYKK